MGRAGRRFRGVAGSAEHLGRQLPVPVDTGVGGEPAPELTAEAGSVTGAVRARVRVHEPVQGLPGAGFPAPAHLAARQVVRRRQPRVQHSRFTGPRGLVRARLTRAAPGARPGHEGVQPGEGEHLGRPGVLGRLRYRHLQERADGPRGHPGRQPTAPEPDQRGGARRSGHRTDQAQPVGALVRRAVEHQLERRLPPAQGPELGSECAQAALDGRLQRVGRVPGVLLVEDAAYFGHGQVETAQRADQVQPLHRVRAVPAVSARAAGRLRQ
ncbi:hypothetical protein ABID94_001064 [Streptomyces sp. PvR018]